MPDVNNCGCYSLPVITGTNLTGNEAFYTGTSGTGTQYIAGNQICNNLTLYIYDTDGVCSDEQSFNINIIPAPNLVNPSPPIEACNNFNLCSYNPPNTGSSGAVSFFNNNGGTVGTQISGLDCTITSSANFYIIEQLGFCRDTATIQVNITFCCPTPSFIGN